MRTLADRIRQARLERGLSQAALTLELKLSRHTVSRWERGESNPTGAYRSLVLEWLGEEKV